MVKLILMRHGQSTANMQNTFTGWTDAPLTDTGRAQANEAGLQLKATGIQINDAHTSLLKRTIMTAMIVCDVIGISWIPLYKTWRLNERHYGALAGLDKDEARQQYGKDQVERWRRGFKDVPPKLAEHEHQSLYDRIGVAIPLAESLAMTQERLLPYWENAIVPRLRAGRNELIVAHGSSLRVLIKHLEGVPDDQLDQIKILNGKPIIYTLNNQLQVIDKQVME